MNCDVRSDGRIAVCIPAHGFSDELLKAIDSIKASEGLNLPDFDIIVSNSGPEFDLDEDFTILPIDRDDYWVGAVKKLYDYCRERGCYDYLLLLNHDCYLGSRCLSEMVSFVDGRTDLVVHSLLCHVDDPERVWWGGSLARCMGHYDWLYGDVSRELIPTHAYEIDSAMGQCLLMPIRAAQSKYLHASSLTHFYGDPVQTVEMKRDGFGLYLLPSAVSYTDQSDQCERTTRLDAINSYSELFRLFMLPHSRFSLKTIFWGEHFLQKCLLGRYFYPVLVVVSCVFRQSVKVFLNKLGIR